MAGSSALVPSLALMPAMFFCEMRISGGGGNMPTAWEPCPLWQSTHVACRLLLSNVSSAASCGLVEFGNGWPIFGVAYAENTFGAGGEMFEPPLWQAMQSCSFGPRSNLAAAVLLWGAWQEMHASA